MAENTGSDGIENKLGDFGFSRVFFNSFLVIISELHDLFITESFDIVGFNESGEHWEAVFLIERYVVFVLENTSNFYLITRSGGVNEVIQDENFFLSGDTAWRNGSRGLLDSPFLVISVDGGVLFQLIRTF
jgi:hypothetical protein